MENNLRILLIEDNPETAQLIIKMFTGLGTGLDLMWADCLSKSMERLAPSNPRTDPILLDLSLSDSQGLDAFTQIHAKVPRAPIIVLTETHDDALAMELMQAGAQDYLIKGEADSRLLVKTIRCAIERCKTEKALSETERMLPTLVSHMPGVAYRCKNYPDWTMECISDIIHDQTRRLNEEFDSYGGCS
jgi:two-component system, cell cycle sensor histidine kinase and response regulator CckA